MDKIKIYDTLNSAYFSDDCHERDVIAHLPLLLRDRSLVADIGASLGQYTRAISRCINDSEILAVEADPVRAEQLARNCRQWSSDSTNTVQALHVALTNSTGTVSYFVTNSDVSGGLTPHQTPRPVDWQEITLESSTLDDLFPNRTPDLVKIDVEGAELLVLQGASRILREGATDFLIEIHDWPAGSSDRNDVLKLMRDSGYAVVTFFGMPLFVRSRRRWLKLKIVELWFRTRRRLR